MSIGSDSFEHYSKVDFKNWDNSIQLWLDDIREPWKHGCMGYQWAKTAEEAIFWLKTGRVRYASLDHDLAWEHYPGSGVDEKDYREETGYTVIRWMEENNVWPEEGVRVHSMNPVGSQNMIKVIERHYGRNFQNVQH